MWVYIERFTHIRRDSTIKLLFSDKKFITKIMLFIINYISDKRFGHCVAAITVPIKVSGDIKSGFCQQKMIAKSIVSLLKLDHFTATPPTLLFYKTE